MKIPYIVVVSLMTSTAIVTVLAETGDDVKEVLNRVFTNAEYNKKVRPKLDQTKPLNVEMDFILQSIIDLDEKEESLKTSGFLNISWVDEYLSWDADSFNKTEFVFVPQDDIWKPDLALQNSFNEFTGLGSTYLNVLVNYTGGVSWQPFQTCELKLSAWSYTKAQVTFMVREGIILDEYVPSALWNLVNTSAEVEGNNEDASVVFKVTLQRRPRFYIINIVIPVILLSLLNVFAFALPATSGERAGYSITVFLSLAVFLTIVSDQLPNNSENTSILAVYLMLISSLSTGIVMLCMVQLRLYSWNDTNKPVGGLYMIFFKCVDCIQCGCCIKRCRKPTVKDGETPVTEIKDNISLVSDTEDKVTWLDVVNAMDFVFFIVSISYTFIVTVVIGAVSITLPKI